MTEAQGWVHHDCPDPGHGPGKGRIIKVCARLAEGKGEADRPAAAPEDDVSAVQFRARRRRGCGRTGGDQERQFKILGSGK